MSAGKIFGNPVCGSNPWEKESSIKNLFISKGNVGINKEEEEDRANEILLPDVYAVGSIERAFLNDCDRRSQKNLQNIVNRPFIHIL